MCNKCDEEIKAAIDHVVVAALKMARLTNLAYEVTALKGLLFTVLPALTPVRVKGWTVVAIVHATSTAAELKNQVRDYMVSLVEQQPEGHLASKVEVVDQSDVAFEPSSNAN